MTGNDVQAVYIQERECVMENRICPVCGEKQSKLIKGIDMMVPESYRLPGHYDVVVCETCGLVYADTKASMEDLDWYYSNFNFYGDDSKDDNSIRYEITQEFLERYCRKDSMLLNIGAGNGRFEVALQKNGYQNITGIDPSEESVKRLKKAGIHAHIGNIYSPVTEKENQKYDCIFLFEVAEHLLFPGEGIKNVGKMLKKDGVFIISVPDYSQIGEDASSIANHFNLEHINYFSEYSLDNLMNFYGLQRIAQKRVGIDLIQCYKSVNKSQKLQKDVVTEKAIKNYFLRQEEKEAEVEAVIAELRAERKEIVIWGTGSYVMRLLSTTDLPKCNIKGFVDNNKIKQGQEMYGYTIYPPNFLQDKKYTVLICSMLNSENIREQLENMNTDNRYIILQDSKHGGIGK